MSLPGIYSSNQKILYQIECAVKEMRIQNFDAGIRYFQQFIKDFQALLQEISTSKTELEKKGIGIDASVLISYLEGSLCAQQQEDYILLADILEMQLLPFLISLQSALKNIEDFSFERSFFDKNLIWIDEYDGEFGKQLRTAFRDLKKQKTEKKNPGRNNFGDVLSSAETGVIRETFPVDMVNASTYIGKDKTQYMVEPSECGELTLRIDHKFKTPIQEENATAYYLHSNQNPRIKATLFAQNYFSADASVFCLVGFGMGYEACELIEKGCRCIPVQVYEPDINVLVLALLYNDFSEILGKQLFIHFDPDLTGLADGLKTEGSRLVIHKPSLNQITNTKLRGIFNNFFIEESSQRNAKDLLEINFHSNLAKIGNKNISLLISKEDLDFSGKDLYIVAAGPSLDKNVELLRKKPANGVILAAGTVFYKLMKLGIRPDYIIVTDPNNRIIRQIRGNENTQVPMLLLSTGNHQFTKLYQGPILIMFQKDFPLSEKYVYSRTSKPLLLETGGSVVTTALDLGIRLMAKRIIFLGLDLAFTDNLAHATDTSSILATDPKNLTQVPSFDGKTVFTDGKFTLYREFIKARIKKTDAESITFINATEGGSYIEGMRHKKLKDVIEN